MHDRQTLYRLSKELGGDACADDGILFCAQELNIFPVLVIF